MRGRSCAIESLSAFANYNACHSGSILRLASAGLAANPDLSRDLTRTILSITLPANEHLSAPVQALPEVNLPDAWQGPAQVMPAVQLTSAQRARRLATVSWLLPPPPPVPVPPLHGWPCGRVTSLPATRALACWLGTASAVQAGSSEALSLLPRPSPIAAPPSSEEAVANAHQEHGSDMLQGCTIKMTRKAVRIGLLAARKLQIHAILRPQ